MREPATPSGVRWFATGDDPERHELARARHPENDSMTVGAVAYVQRLGDGWWRWETYPGRHRTGRNKHLTTAKRRAASALGLNPLDT